MDFQKCVENIRRRSSTVLSSMSRFWKTLELTKRGAICRSEKEICPGWNQGGKSTNFFSEDFLLSLSRAEASATKALKRDEYSSRFCPFLPDKIENLDPHDNILWNPVSSRFYPFSENINIKTNQLIYSQCIQ